MSKEIYEQAICLWGSEIQKIIFFEEIGELMKAISKYERTVFFEKDAAEPKLKIIEEIADVEIMLAQLKIIYSIDNFFFKTVKDEKIERLKSRIEEEKLRRKTNDD